MTKTNSLLKDSFINRIFLKVNKMLFIHVHIPHCFNKCKKSVFCLMQVENFGLKTKPSINIHLKYEKNPQTYTNLSSLNFISIK